MNNQLDPLAHAKDTLIDLAIRFGPKLLVAILILTAGFFVAGWVGRGDWTRPASLRSRAARAAALDPRGARAGGRPVRHHGAAESRRRTSAADRRAGRRRRRHRSGDPGRVEQHGRGPHHHFHQAVPRRRIHRHRRRRGPGGDHHSVQYRAHHPDRSRIIVPNRKVVGEILHNYGRIRQSEIRVGVAYESDLPLALGAIGELVGRIRACWRIPRP